MSAIWADINEELTIRKTLYPRKYRRKATDPDQLSFNEILYADDTILLQHKAKELEEQLQLLEEEAGKYGLQLNKKNANTSG